VTNLKNGKSSDVKINDRGPELGIRKIDLSKKATNEIGLTRREGAAPVKIEVIRKPASRGGRTTPSSTSHSTDPPQ
jgi:rare lipoprotein A